MYYILYYIMYKLDITVIKDMMIAFICDKKDIDSGQFEMDDLEIMTLNTGACVVIRDHGKIINGEFFYDN